jgi:hypothetical protein
MRFKIFPITFTILSSLCHYWSIFTNFYFSHASQAFYFILYSLIDHFHFVIFFPLFFHISSICIYFIFIFLLLFHYDCLYTYSHSHFIHQTFWCLACMFLYSSVLTSFHLSLCISVFRSFCDTFIIVSSYPRVPVSWCPRILLSSYPPVLMFSCPRVLVFPCPASY